MKQREEWEHLLRQPRGHARHTQDSPILPEVWWHYLDKPGEPAQLLLTPWRSKRPRDLIKAVYDLGFKPAPIDQDGPPPEGHFVANETVVAVRLAFEKLVECVVPLSEWWQKRIAKHVPGLLDLNQQETKDLVTDLEQLEEPDKPPRSGFEPLFLWWLRIVGVVALRQGKRVPSREVKAVLEAALELTVRPMVWGKNLPTEPCCYSVALDRKATASVVNSRRTVKADAAKRVFDVNCSRLAWAVFDSGVDSTHVVFSGQQEREQEGSSGSRSKKVSSSKKAKKAKKKRGKTGRGAASDGPRSRVAAAFDFTKLRRLLELASSPNQEDHDLFAREYGFDLEKGKTLARSIRESRQTEWDLLRPQLEVSDETTYVAHLHPHGTHVAGVLAGDPPEEHLRTKAVSSSGEEIEVGPGICRDLQLYDFRILDEKGEGHEFDIIAALQFLRHLNAHSKKLLVHGANLSFSIPHDVRNYAAGRTPVCNECDRLVASGVVTVAAGGNLGVDKSDLSGQIKEGGSYRDISITDPGNADSVVTVGATHRKRPHEYGVSFFSSRGPTGDGRLKPDLVAPGEKIVSAVPGDKYDVMDGTSQAAPHVSGAAAMLMARHEELIGQPRRVKEILCETATDLGRERYFQGHGLVDILRAIQKV